MKASILLIIMFVGILILLAIGILIPVKESDMEKNCKAGHRYIATCEMKQPFEHKIWMEEVCDTCGYLEEGTYVTDCPCGLGARIIKWQHLDGNLKLIEGWD